MGAFIQELIRNGDVAGYWDAHAGHFVDLTGNGRDGIVQAAALWEGFGIRRADGLVGAVNVANHASLQLATFTAVGVFDRSSLVAGSYFGHQYLFYKANQFAFGINANFRSYLNDFTNNRYTGVSVTSQNKCFAVSLADGGTGTVYMDGLSIGPLNGASTVTASANDLQIGGCNSTLRQGLLINRVLTATEHAVLYAELLDEAYPTKFYAYAKRTQAINQAEPGLVAGWDMKPAGGVIPDIAGTSDGTIVGAPMPEQGILGNRLLFDGVADYINCGNVGTIKSVAFWTNPVGAREDFLDLDGGTHTVEVAAGVITATGWAAPTIYVDGVAGTALISGVRQRIVVSTATAFAASAVHLGEETLFLEGTMGKPEFFSTERTAAWVLADYTNGASAIQFKSGWAYQVSPAAEGGVLNQIIGTRSSPIRAGNTNFRGLIEVEEVNGQLCKVLRCTVAGAVNIPAELFFDASPTECAFGTYDLWASKADVSLMDINLISNSGIGATTGYGFAWAGNEAVVIFEYGVGALIAGGTASHSVWHRFRLTRSSAGIFTAYIDGVAFGTSVAELTTTTSNFMLFDMNLNDKICLGNVQGDDGIVKYLGVVAP